MTLSIGGLKCSVTEPRTEEWIFREATRMINDKIARYREKHVQMDPYRLLAYVTIDLTTSLIEEKRSNDVEPLLERVREINRRLGSVLKE